MIDAHAHIWDAHRFPMAWLRKAPRLRHTYTFDDLITDAGDVAPEQVVLVQAGTDLAGTLWLLSTTAPEPRVGAVVATSLVGHGETWRDLEHRARTALGADGGDRLRGFRINALGHDDDFFDGPDARSVMAVLAGHGLGVHLLVRAAQLAGVARLAATAPVVPVLIDHLGTPPWRDDRATWRRGIRAAAGVANLTAKLSGAALVAPQQSGMAESAVEHVIEHFGPERVAFGSDWPASTLDLSYGDVVARTRQILANVGADPHSDPIWSGVATRALRLRDSSGQAAGSAAGDLTMRAATR